MRVIIDTVNDKIIACGEGPINIQAPPGSQTYSMVQAPSGHLLLPVSDYAALQRFTAERNRLEQAPEPVSLPVLPPAAATTAPSTTGSSSSSSGPPASQQGFPCQASRSVSQSGVPDATGQDH